MAQSNSTPAVKSVFAYGPVKLRYSGERDPGLWLSQTALQQCKVSWLMAQSNSATVERKKWVAYYSKN